MLEFLAAKGSWDYAVRLAYQKAVASGPGDAAAGDNYLLPSAANTAPTPAWYEICSFLNTLYPYRRIFSGPSTSFSFATACFLSCVLFNDSILDSILLYHFW